MIRVRDLFALADRLGGVPLLGCVPGSPAHRAGLRYGDILLSYGGHPTPHAEAYLQARVDVESQDEVVVEVFRLGSIERVVLDRTPRAPALAEGLSPAPFSWRVVRGGSC